jgi:hypothetical protein
MARSERGSASVDPAVSEYLAGLPVERRAALEAVRAVIGANLPTGIVETVDFGMITYVIPLDVVPKTYNGKPLMFAALASQKRHMAIYLSAIYGDPALHAWFVDEYGATGLRMDLGKSCVRFRTLDELPLDLIGRAIARCSTQRLIELYAGRSLRANR